MKKSLFFVFVILVILFSHADADVSSNKVNLDPETIRDTWISGGKTFPGIVIADFCNPPKEFLAIFESFTNPDSKGFPLMVDLAYMEEPIKIVGIVWMEGYTKWHFDRNCTGEWEQISPKPLK